MHSISSHFLERNKFLKTFYWQEKTKNRKYKRKYFTSNRYNFQKIHLNYLARNLRMGDESPM